jgi:hypothetical protein
VRRLLAAALLVLAARPAAAQYISLEPDRDSIRVGDVVTLAMRVHLGPQETLADYVPALSDALPEGVRLVGADTLVRDSSRVLGAAVRFQFLRPGEHDVPTLQVVVRHTPTDRGTPYRSDPLRVTVVPLVPAGNPALRDIHDPVPAGGPDPRLLAAAAAIGALGWVAFRRMRARPAPDLVAPAPPPPPPDPRADALAELARIRDAGWAAREPVTAVALASGVLRRWIDATVPGAASALTTRELLAAVPDGDRLGSPVRRALQGADMVKFAAVRPDAAWAERFLETVRDTLEAA